MGGLGQGYSTVCPRVSFHDARDSWFLYQGNVYSVRACQSSVFKDSIEQYRVKKGRKNEDERVAELMQADTLDIFERWFLLCEVPSLPLFTSYEHAQRVHNQQERSKARA